MLDPAPPHSPPAPAPPRRARRRGVVAAVVVAALLLTGGGLLGLAYAKLEGNLTAEDVRDRIMGDRPAEAVGTGGGRPLNVLLIGSDDRSGANAKYGRVDGARADVTVLLHLSADRERAVAVSIPRDSMVRIPDCAGRQGRTIPGELDMFNDAYARGGSACTIATVEANTGIRVDHHVVVDFQGFKAMVNALDGVSVCLPEAVRDEDSKLDLPAGRHVVRDETALAFVRNRSGSGVPDLGRIKRQQQFLAAMAQKATAAGTLTDPRKLYGFLDAATSSLTTDPQLADLNELRKLAQSVQGIGLDRIRFLTVPVRAYRPDPNRLQWKEEAQTLWALLREDRPLPGETTAATPGASTPARPAVRVAPREVAVRVLNATLVPGAARRAAADLRRVGFRVVAVDEAYRRGYAGTTVRHDPGYDQSARTLASAVPGAQTRPAPELSSTLELVVGGDYAGVRAVTVAPPRSRSTPSPAFTARTADKDVCA